MPRPRAHTGWNASCCRRSGRGRRPRRGRPLRWRWEAGCESFSRPRPPRRRPSLHRSQTRSGAPPRPARGTSAGYLRRSRHGTASTSRRPVDGGFGRRRRHPEGHRHRNRLQWERVGCRPGRSSRRRRRAVGLVQADERVCRASSSTKTCRRWKRGRRSSPSKPRRRGRRPSASMVAATCQQSPFATSRGFDHTADATCAGAGAGAFAGLVVGRTGEGDPAAAVDGVAAIESGVAEASGAATSDDVGVDPHPATTVTTIVAATTHRRKQGHGALLSTADGRPREVQTLHSIRLLPRHPVLSGYPGGARSGQNRRRGVVSSGTTTR